MTVAWQRTLPAMLLAGATAIATVPAAAQSDPPAAAKAVFAPPPGQPMLLSRTLTRELADGKAIVATRRYRIAFARTATGWRIDGTLVASEIDAPPALSALAELERNRPDDGLFPIALDAAGTIVPRAAGAAPPQQGAAAVEQAIAMVVARLASGEEALSARLLQEVQALAAGAAMSRWPVELFRPEQAASRDRRHYALPDGGEGIVTVELTREPAADAATMGACSRRVTTEFAGSRRESRERWTLAPLDQVASR